MMHNISHQQMLNSTHLPVVMHNRTYQECKQQLHTLCPGSTGVHYKVPLLYHNWKKNQGGKKSFSLYTTATRRQV